MLFLLITTMGPLNFTKLAALHFARLQFKVIGKMRAQNLYFGKNMNITKIDKIKANENTQ